MFLGTPSDIFEGRMCFLGGLEYKWIKWESHHLEKLRENLLWERERTRSTIFFIGLYCGSWFFISLWYSMVDLFSYVSYLVVQVYCLSFVLDCFVSISAIRESWDVVRGVCAGIGIISYQVLYLVCTTGTAVAIFLMLIPCHRGMYV